MQYIIEKFNTRWILCVIVFFSCATQVSWREPQEILLKINKEGAKKVVIYLSKEKRNEWENILNNIESGNSAWLNVAKALRPGTDASTTTELCFAVARALPKSPTEVLSLVDNGFTLDEICIIPFIEEERNVEIEYLKNVKEALNRAMVGLKNENCLRCLEKIEQYLALYNSEQ